MGLDILSRFFFFDHISQYIAKSSQNRPHIRIWYLLVEHKMLLGYIQYNTVHI